MKHEIKMLITAYLIKLTFKVIPKNKEGYKLIEQMIEYLQVAP